MHAGEFSWGQCREAIVHALKRVLESAEVCDNVKHKSKSEAAGKQKYAAGFL